MSQSVYCGISGSGKSYEVVRGVIVPGVANGRRVVTNVAGLQIQAIYDYCVNKLGVDRDKLGSVVQLHNEDIELPNLFPLEKTPKAFEDWKKKARIEERKQLGVCLPDDVLDLMWDEQSIVQGGDIVVIDECRRWYETGAKVPEGHIHFFRMHRHFLHWESGIACDVVFITQDFADLQRKVVGNNDRAYCMQKHDALGFSDRYVINIYQGKTQNSKTLIETIQDKYNPEIFKLYNSHSQKKAGIEVPREIKADKRGNVLNNKYIKYGFPFAAVMILSASYFVYGFFHPKVTVKTETAASAPGTVETKPEPKRDEVDNISQKFRLVGYTREGSSYTFLIADEHGRTRQLRPLAFQIAGNEIELALPSGHIVTRWTGPLPPSRPGAAP